MGALRVRAHRPRHPPTVGCLTDRWLAVSVRCGVLSLSLWTLHRPPCRPRTVTNSLSTSTCPRAQNTISRTFYIGAAGPLPWKSLPVVSIHLCVQSVGRYEALGLHPDRTAASTSAALHTRAAAPPGANHTAQLARAVLTQRPKRGDHTSTNILPKDIVANQ